MPRGRALDPSQRRQRTLDAVKRLCCGRARSSRSCCSSRTCTGSTPRPRRCSTASSRACRPPGCCCSSTTGPSTSTGGASKTYYRQLRIDPLPAESAEDLLTRPARDRPEPRRAQAHPRSSGRRATRSSSRRACGPWWRPGRWSGSAAPTGWRTTPRRSRCRRRSRRSWPPASTACRPRTSGCSRPPRSSARTCRSRCCSRSPSWPRKTLRRGLDHLQAAEFLYETRLFPDLEYTFKHALTHEVAYGGLLQERRRDLHARIVEAIETLHRDRLGEQIERLAHHALRGEVWEKAVPYLRQAGLKAAGALGAPRGPGVARAGAGGARGAAGEPGHARAEGFDIRLELRPLLGQLGEYRRVLERLREAEAIAETLERRPPPGPGLRGHDQRALAARRAGRGARVRHPGADDRPAPRGPGPSPPDHDLSRAGALLPRRVRASGGAGHRQPRGAARRLGLRVVRGRHADRDLRSLPPGQEPRAARPLRRGRPVRGRGAPARRADAPCLSRSAWPTWPRAGCTCSRGTGPGRAR